MELTDALTVTALGMGVVFCGLILTSLLIVAFGALPRLLDRDTTPPAATAPPRAAGPPEQPEVTPEVLSVILAVLEVERRLYRAVPERRTIPRQRPGETRS